MRKKFRQFNYTTLLLLLLNIVTGRLTLMMLNNVDLLMGSNPDSVQYFKYS